MRSRWKFALGMCLAAVSIALLAVQSLRLTRERDTLARERTSFCIHAAAEFAAISLQLAEPSQQRAGAIVILDPHLDDDARLCAGRELMEAFLPRRERCFPLARDQDPDFDCASKWAAQVSAMMVMRIPH